MSIIVCCCSLLIHAPRKLCVFLAQWRLCHTNDMWYVYNGVEELIGAPSVCAWFVPQLIVVVVTATHRHPLHTHVLYADMCTMLTHSPVHACTHTHTHARTHARMHPPTHPPTLALTGHVKNVLPLYWKFNAYCLRSCWEHSTLIFCLCWSTVTFHPVQGHWNKHEHKWYGIRKSTVLASLNVIA